MKRQRIAVLGAGIMGACLAVNLARRGAEVTLVDRRPHPLQEASRYNEGKIHLGYLYGADATLNTARHLLPGGLSFGRLITRLLEADLASHTTTDDDLYLVDRDSVVTADDLGRQFDAVSALIREHPDASDYLVDASGATATRLTPAELDGLATDRVLADFRVPERSVQTTWIADQLSALVLAEPRVRFVPGTTVGAVDLGGPVRVRGESFDEPFDVVVNALWGGRIAIDLTAGVPLPKTWTHRVRWCLFVHTTRPIDVPSALVAVGPFGDVKNYNGRDFYLSWYPKGLVAVGTDVTLQAPQPPRGAAAADFIAGVRAGLATALPRIGEVLDAADTIDIAGGHVFAEGRGAIGDPASELHRRDRFGVTQHGPYYSVDTGKYSTAPWLADRLASRIMGG